jgi:hypothetical protein
MPEISRFYGIVVRMFYDELRQNWARAESGEPPVPIQPLD